MDEEEELSGPEAALIEEDTLEIITIMFDRKSTDVPHLNLGNTTPWVAIPLLKSAIQTLEMLIPPVDVTYKEQLICQNSFEIMDSDHVDFDDDDLD